MNSLTILDFNFQGTPLTYILDEHKEPWFNANEVCSMLGYLNPRQALDDHVDGDDVSKRYVTDTLGRDQLTNFINEPGLYALIFGSRLPAAKAFKRWVCKEVLPAIRKTGTYSTPRRMRLDAEQIRATLDPVVKSFWKLKTPDAILASLALIEGAEREMRVSFGELRDFLEFRLAAVVPSRYSDRTSPEQLTN